MMSGFVSDAEEDWSQMALSPRMMRCQLLCRHDSGRAMHTKADLSPFLCWSITRAENRPTVVWRGTKRDLFIESPSARRGQLYLFLVAPILCKINSSKGSRKV